MNAPFLAAFKVSNDSEAEMWLGAALFRFDENRITELWVLGDLAGLDAKLEGGRSMVAGS